jgi:mannosyltransferase
VRRFFLGLLAAVIAAGWLRVLPESLWLDECGTVFVISGTWAELLARQQVFVGSLPHLTVSWLLLQLFGFSEVLLRLPSLIAMFAAAVLLFLYSRRHLGTDTACLVVALFAVHGNMQAHGTETRPYAFSVLFAAAAFYFVDRWMWRGGMGSAVALGLAAGLLPANHLLAATVLPILLLTAAAYRRRHPLSHYAALALSFALPALLVIPTLHAFDDQGSVQLRDWLARPTLNTWLALYTHRALFLPSLAAAAVAFAFTRPWQWERPRAPLPLLVYAIGLGVVLPLIMFVLSRTGPVSIFTSRYMIAADIGIILLYALAAHGLHPARARLAVACSLLVLVLGYSIVGGGIRRQFRSEDWRAALNSLRGRVPTISMQTGFVEGRDERWLRDPLRSRFLSAPAVVYPPGVPVTPLPYGQPAMDSPYMDEVLEGARGKPVGLIVFPGEKLTARFVQAGFTLELVGRFGPLSTWIATAK